MAFIEKKNPIVLNIKLTSKGRELLSAGQLDFKYYAIGDSEIDYKFNAEVQAVDAGYSAFDSSILQPVDKNPKLLSFIPKNVSGDSYNLIPLIPSAYIVENQIESLGFFTDLSTNPKFIIDTNHVKQPDVMIVMSGVTGGKVLYDVQKAPTYGTSGEEPEVDDLMLIKWSISASTTGHTINIDNPTQYLWYKIDSITGTSLTTGLNITVDRDLPDFNALGISDVYAGIMIYYNEITFSGSSVFNLSSTDYVDEAVLSFLENNQCPTVVFPYWNMSIIYTEEIAGVQAGNLKFTQFKNRKLGGFVSYIQNQAPLNKKLGVVHYTNSSPANVYGEGFLLKTLRLDIPTIMWHKSPTPTLGASFIPNGSPQLLTGVDKSLNTTYYDLVDETNPSIIVGKVFNELKLVVIEDQELLYAMEYKSNRNFTLPNYDADTNTIIVSNPPATGGTNVTWTTPYNDTYEGVIGTCTSYIMSQEYCHSNQGWTTFPVGTTISCGNISDAGYRISGCNNVSPYGGGISICARDYITETNISTTNVGGGPPPYPSSKWTATLIGINNLTGFFFDGCITN